MDDVNRIMDLLDKLDASIKSLIKTGKEYGAAHTDYRLKLSEKLLSLEAEGRPVTNLYYIARGDKDVALAKFREISSEAVYKANQESIQAQKLRIKILEAQLEREWGNTR